MKNIRFGKKIIKNGVMIESYLLTIDPFSDFFQYGFGLFETILYIPKRILFLKEHLKRLELSALYFQIKDIDFLENLEEKHIINLVKANDLSHQRCRIKIILFHKNVIVLTFPLKEFKPTITLSSQYFTADPFRDKHKTLNYMQAIFLKATIQEEDFLRKNTKQEIIEAGMANIGRIDYNNNLYLIDQKEPILTGIIQEKILILCKDIFKNIFFEKGFTEKDLFKNSQSILYINSLGIKTITKIGNQILRNDLKYTLLMNKKLGLI